MAAPLFRLVLFLLFAAMPFSVHSLRFDLKSGDTKCFHEDIKRNAVAVVRYAVVNADYVPGSEDLHPSGPNIKISIKMVDPLGNDVHYVEDVGSGNFAFTASRDGDHVACFWVLHRQAPVTVTVDFDLKTGLLFAKRLPPAATKGNIEVLKLHLVMMEDAVKSIHEEMNDLREREEEMRDFNMSTNKRMAWLSLLSFAVCMSVAGVQLWHLKIFFQKKKLL